MKPLEKRALVQIDTLLKSVDIHGIYTKVLSRLRELGASEEQITILKEAFRHEYMRDESSKVDEAKKWLDILIKEE